MGVDNGSTASTDKDADAVPEKRPGLSVIGAAFFITGMVAGSGMLALANAVTQTGNPINQLLIEVFVCYETVCDKM